MDLPAFFPFCYPPVPVQFDQHLRLQDSCSVPVPMYYPHTPNMPEGHQYLPKPASPDVTSYNKNELRSSVFNQILRSFPELSNMPSFREPSSCMYASKNKPDRFSERQPYYSSIASDIVRDEFETDTDTPSLDHQYDQTSASSDVVSDLLENALENVTSTSAKPKEPITCDVCNKTFRTKYNLKMHQQTHKDRPRPHQCQYCLKRFTQRSTLRTHVRIHTGEKPYVCTYCPKRFADFSTFTKHERIHTGHRPYVCTVCGKAFAQSGNMQRHRETHN